MQNFTLLDLGWNHYFQSQLDLDELSSQLPFRVIAVERSLIECLGLDAEGQEKQLQLPFYHWRNKPPEDCPAIGDWLMLNSSLQPLRLLERKTCIKRKQAGKESLLQLIASNIDTLFIVMSCNHDFSINRLERYLTIAAESGIYCVLVLTKSDLYPDINTYTNTVATHHPNLSTEVINATEPSSLTPLKKWIAKGQTVALVGSSGVGKSTIINTLLGKEAQVTAGIRENDSKGRHTTTSRSLHRLLDGGLLIDNPGMRELQIIDNEQGIKTAFADIDQLSEHCRFKDCQHKSEPDCAVIKAIQAGELEQRRLDNYHKLLSEHARNNESLAERRHNDRALGRFYKSALKSSREFKSKE